jgi:hypothetical protein
MPTRSIVTRLSWGGLPAQKALASAQPGPMHVIYTSVHTGIQAAHRTDSHGHRPQNRLTCTNQQAELCAPTASSQGERTPRQGRRTTHRRRLSPRTGDTGIKDCYSGTCNHDDRGTGGAAASCRGPPRRGRKPPARPRHYPPAPDTRTPQADGAARHLPSQHDSDLPAELVTPINLPCTPDVPGIHLPWTCAAPGESQRPRRRIRFCRNEYFIRAYIYVRSGIPTHALSALPAITVRSFHRSGRKSDRRISTPATTVGRL